MAKVSSGLLAQYGEACVALEIAQNRQMELKRAIAEQMNKPEEQKAE
jgi:hypothetical protein